MARVFTSYRRSEAAAYAGWLTQILAQHFSPQEVFRDLDSIEPGVDFLEAIEQELDTAEVMLVLIGKSWLAVEDSTGQPRLQDPNDYVRLEIAAALARQDIRVIPVLLQGALMPRIEELPEELASLARRNAIELRDRSWQTDVEQLIVPILERVLGRERERQAERKRTKPEQSRVSFQAILKKIQMLGRVGERQTESQRAEPKQSPASFREADRRYAELKQDFKGGAITDKEFRTQLHDDLMVQDDRSRWWAKSPQTGSWHYYDTDTDKWVQATPPGY